MAPLDFQTSDSPENQVNFSNYPRHYWMNPHQWMGGKNHSNWCHDNCRDKVQLFWEATKFCKIYIFYHSSSASCAWKLKRHSRPEDLSFTQPMSASLVVSVLQNLAIFSMLFCSYTPWCCSTIRNSNCVTVVLQACSML